MHPKKALFLILLGNARDNYGSFSYRKLICNSIVQNFILHNTFNIQYKNTDIQPSPMH